jgi:hypothetical protein
LNNNILPTNQHTLLGFTLYYTARQKDQHKSTGSEAALKMMMKLIPLVTNLLAQNADVPVIIVLCQSVSPTKLCPTLPVDTTRSYAQLLCQILFSMHQKEWYKSRVNFINILCMPFAPIFLHQQLQS